MPGDFKNLTTPGRALETFVTVMRVSERFLRALADQQLAGRWGHPEWLVPTVALRAGLRLTFVEHPLQGRSESRQRRCSRSKVGGTFDFCCRAAPSEAERWFRAWRSHDACAPLALLHPVKGDQCGKFTLPPLADSGGCWERRPQAEPPARNSTNFATTQSQSLDLANRASLVIDFQRAPTSLLYKPGT